MQRTLRTDTRQKYFLYVPQRGGNSAKIFVTVHGISRNAMEHARKFSAFAEKFGVVMIAPYFPSEDFPDYQRLGRKGKRADIMLNEIVSEVTELTGASAHKLYLFGYSGGAQFVHRYMLAYPDRVTKVVLGAPGWYTFSNPTLKYPRGIQESRSLPQIQFDPAKFLNIPVCVLVGEKDNQRDAELNQSPQIDILQGRTRIERGQRWVDEMISQARTHKDYQQFMLFACCLIRHIHFPLVCDAAVWGEKLLISFFLQSEPVSFTKSPHRQCIQDALNR